MNDSPKKHVLHVGCGVKKPGRLHAMFSSPEWEETRLDINPDSRPDLVASITDMRIVETGSMDALYSSHNLEHLFPHEVALALTEFRRVLKPDGMALIAMPDIQTVAEVIAAGHAAKPLYKSPMGPVTALDIVYGHHKALAGGNLFMLHKCGFTAPLLHAALMSAGFASVMIRRDKATYSLWAKAYVTKQEERPPAQTGPFGPATA